jgi:hypothetical protein
MDHSRVVPVDTKALAVRFSGEALRAGFAPRIAKVRQGAKVPRSMPARGRPHRSLEHEVEQRDAVLASRPATAANPVKTNWFAWLPW